MESTRKCVTSPVVLDGDTVLRFRAMSDVSPSSRRVIVGPVAVTRDGWKTVKMHGNI